MPVMRIADLKSSGKDPEKKGKADPAMCVDAAVMNAVAD
jgi:hypothetical protein